MLPRLSIDERADSRFSNAKFCGQFRIGFRGHIANKANGQNLFLREFYESSSCSDNMSSLAHLIVRIVKLGADEKVTGIDASLVIAPMKNKHSVRDRTISHRPRRTMGAHVSGRLIDENQAIASSSTGASCPVPAFFFTAAIYFVPKAFLVWNSWRVTLGAISIAALLKRFLGPLTAFPLHLSSIAEYSEFTCP